MIGHGAPGHRHGHEPERGGETARSARALGLALGVTLSLLLVEAVGGWVTGSLALLADAGHLLVDVGALGLGVVGSWVASRPATSQMSYGYRRAEILAAVTNGVALWVIAAAIIYEAVRRLGAPHPVVAPAMLVVAVVGLAGNLASTALLARSGGENLNVRAALVHVLGDAAAAVGTIAASLVILTTGWTAADAWVSFGIAGLLLVGSWAPVRDAVAILMEATPRGISMPAVEAAMRAVPGVLEIHDLHVWSLTAGVPAVSAHVRIANPAEGHHILMALCTTLHERFGLSHTTIQLETEAVEAPWHTDCAPEVRPRATGGVPR
ncbi:MAG TPA: cation diffusion facilitator family transporter [bacterium]|nr:cation diffusion facilitator family transporter [bacterium]